MSVLFISTSGLQAQSCPGDNLPPDPADAAGVAQTSPAINTPSNPVFVNLNKFGVGAIASDSGQYDPLTGTGARMYVEAAFTTGGSDSIFTTATDSYVDGNGNTVLCNAPNSPKITASQTTFFCDDLGLNTITLTYTDAANNTENRTVYIMVVDPSSPVVIAQTATFALDANGLLTVSDADAVAFNGGTYSQFGTDTGYCADAYTYSISPNTFDCDDLGSQSVVLTVTNPSNGATGTANATIIVVDDAEPVITVTDPNPTVQLNANGDGILFFADVASSADNCDATPTNSIIPSTFDCSQAGTTVQTVLRSEDASGNVAFDTIDVDVEDVIDPVFAQTGSPELGANGKVGLEDAAWYTVTENCEYTITFTPDSLDCDAITTPVSVSYVLTDASNNTVTGTVSVSAVDNLEPTVVTQDITVSLDQDGLYTLLPSEVDNGSSDNCSLDNATVTPDQFNCGDVGPNTVTLTWTDESGNSSSATATVTVEDNTAPNTVALSGQYVLFSNQLLNGEISVTATVLNPTSTDNCEITDTVLTDVDSNLFYVPGQLINTFTCDDVSYTDVNGVYIDKSRDIVIHNIDAAGNWSRDTANVILVDVDAPSITVQNANVSLGADGTVDLLSDNYVTAADECGVDSIWLSQTEFDCSDLGTQTIYAYARDIHNNADSVTLTVTVVDDLDPVITLVQSSLSLYLNPTTGEVSLPADVSTLATATDNCTDPQAVTLSQTDFDCSHVGSNTVVVTAEDESGNVATANISVSILDTVAPVLDIDNSHTIQLDGSGLASLTVNDVDVASSDNCAIDSRTLSQTSFDCDDLGTNTITFTATDAGGNATSESVTVTVEDNVDPVAVASDITVELSAAGGVTITPAQIDNGSSDNCAITSYSLSQTSFDCDDIGNNVVTLTVTDASGNSDQATATVTIEDAMKPELELLASGDTLRLNQFGQRVVTVPGIIGDVSDNCTDANDVVINVTYTNSCNNVTKSGTSITLDCSDDSRACSTLPDYDLRTFTITATDEEGNVETVTRDYFVIDLFAPNVYPENLTLYLPEDPGGNAQVTTDAGVWTGNEAGTALDPVGLDSATEDACGIVSKALLRTATQSTPDQTHTYSCEDLGANTYFLRATDVYDNRAAYQGVVTIVDTIKPDITTTIADIYVDADGNATLDPEDLIDAASDNIEICGLVTTASRIDYSCTADLRWDATIVNPNKADARNTANWDTVGVRAFVTDIADNVRSRIAGVRVMDTLPPVLIRQTIDVDLGPNNYVSLQDVQDTIIAFVSSDNCSLDPDRGGLARTYFDCDDVGPNSVTLTMFDTYGNSQQVQLNVIVHDRVAPTAIAQDITVELDATGNVTVAASAVDNGSTDNCEIVSYSLDVSSFDCSNVGQNNVVLTVTDREGNTASATAVISVEDNIAPDLTNVPTTITLELDANGIAVMDSAYFGAFVDEACDFTTSFSVDTFDCDDVAANLVPNGPALVLVEANSPVGDHVVNYTVVDASGNSETIQIGVIVEDNIDPVANVLASIDLFLDANGNATLDFEDHLNNGSFDNCSYEATLSQTDFDCDDVNQAITVTGTLEDPSGNTANFSVDVTTRDTVAPVFSSAQGDTTLYAVQYDCFAIFATGNDVPTFDAMDQNCPGAVTYYYQLVDEFGNTNTISEGSPIPVGQWVVNTIASDIQGNTSISAFNVTVIDTTLPTMQFLNSPVIALGSNGQTTITPAMVENSSYDNCGIESVEITPAVVDCDDLGAVTLTVAVTDWNTNVRTYSNISATVVDEEAPQITVEADPVVVALDANGDASITTSDVVSDVVDNCTPDANITVSVSPSTFDCSDAGSVTVTITATDASGNTSVATKAVTVVDQIAPVISVSNISLDLGANGSVALPLGTATALDNCTSASVEYSTTTFTCSDLGANTVTVTSKDASGNTSTALFTVTVSDATDPTLSAVTSPVVVALDANGSGSITESDVVAAYADNCGTVTVSVTPTSFGCSDLGSNNVTITATDASGNTTTVTKAVNVVDNMNPVLTMSAAPVALYLDATGSATINASGLGASATDNCTAAPTVTLSNTTFSCAELGSNTITVTAVDASGNSVSATKSVTVYDTLSPTITVPASVALNIGASGSVALGNPASATDNCGQPVITYDVTSFDCSDLGTNTVVVTATDANGNVSTSNMTVVVSDNIDPTLNLVSSAVTLALDASGSAVLSTSQVVSSVTDNCSGVTVTVSPNSFGCSDVGANTVTVTATDGSGNTTTSTTSITVVDNIDPVITVVANPADVILDATGSGSITAAMVASATDNCTAAPTITVTPTTVDCSDLGVVTVTVIASDANGNTSTASVPLNVVDNAAPVITSAQGDTTLAACEAQFNYAVNVTDNCGFTATMTSGLASGSTFPVGTTTVTWVFADASGNSVTHSFDVTVEPLGTYTLPVKDEFCFDNGPFDLQDGQTGLVFSGAGVTATGDIFQPAVAGIGTHTLNFTFTDANGCEQIGTWTVTVNPTPQQPTVLQMTPTTLRSSEAGASYKWYRNGNRLVGETNQDLFITQGGNYQVEVYNAFGCFRRSTGFVISSTGLSVEELLKDVSIYPNPTSSQVSIVFNWALESDLSVEVIDMLGRSLYNGSIDAGDVSHTIDMSSMTAGTYQLIVRDNETGNSTIERIIKVD